MNATLPPSVAHHFSIKKIGKVFAAFCVKCSWRANFMCFPITPATHSKLIRHVDHHSTFDDYVHRRGVEPTDVQAGEEK